MNDMPWRFKKGQQAHNKRHGLSHTRTHNCWMQMKRRCYDTKGNRYQYYGGRGITVCERWIVFENFLSDMGTCPEGQSLDRINVDGNYEPSNCRWATNMQQGEHRSNAIKLSFKGKTQHIGAWAREVGIPAKILYKRVTRGWTPEQILTIPPCAITDKKVKPFDRSTVSYIPVTGQ